MHLISSFYSRARDEPVPGKTPQLFFKLAGTSFIYFQLLFFGLFCYILGSLFQQTDHTHNIRITFVDYDRDAIGRAVRLAYASIEGKAFPTLVERPASEFPTINDLVGTVCRTEYWGALYVVKGASLRLHEALAGDKTYNNTDAMGYIWNEAFYSSIIDSAVSVNLQLLSDTARVAYTTANGTANISSITSPAALSAFANPWELQSINIKPTPQGSRAIYNTVVIIIVLMQQFFYLGTLNGRYAQLKVYTLVNPYRIIITRNMITLSYTFIGSLLTMGAIWAFRAGWDVNGNQFVLSWITLWLFAHINFLIFEIFTIWLQSSFVPMALISWIVFNITSVLLPFQLSPGFYHIGYMFPAHNYYQVLINIWSLGCNPKLHYALPVLFAWELVALVLTSVGVFRRCHLAMAARAG
ncbi:uncharacterized protein NECHADRAFT_68902 [Fusarium vanettenii 77-13-4]|uniref:DUF3533 domain-containing protein n=1 Tax=Fusarium vanettenii (strain ATCC MYA-4622 / CBS 123669 / FGSC 9596 / NRRL 45880 / 77-13-4) TaxID=660122 RepID=C7ZM45_FUSV7|nr:uncharacterized protein NECHADRAFT_68902 [Fusarium vanettenii 77-13-4]EEU34902.1 hypothetical protein NECHADRAFT_68902 [Fusarium vanettenii 77-13-4]